MNAGVDQCADLIERCSRAEEGREQFSQPTDIDIKRKPSIHQEVKQGTTSTTNYEVPVEFAF